MKVEILYFEGCPNHVPTVELVQAVSAEIGAGASIEQIEIRGVEDAERLRFLGSPTVLVDGLDIEPAARDRSVYAVSCRLYGDSGVPPRKMVRAALSAGGAS